MISVRRQIGGLGNLLFKEAYLMSQVQKGDIPDVYVQDPAYFSGIDNYIKTVFGQNITTLNQVAIHVRRGDYVGNSFYVDLSETPYYEQAMMEFPDADFLVFSDDISWCKKQPIFAGCEFSEGHTEVEDLNLMASCTGHIIANSSFSWWAAYLSPNGGKVIAPKLWYADSVERTKCPPHWKRI